MQYQFGPHLDPAGASFRLWAPSRSRIELLIEGAPPVDMHKGDDGFWSVHVEGVVLGSRYRFRSDGLEFPDPAARQQAGGTAGWSVLRGPAGDSTRSGPLRPWHETILCEVHVGTATPEGTFRGLAEWLEHFRDAGYTGLELMPLNAFPGSRNWGYDGTLLFAPAEAYGTPEELRALVDRAHALGLCLIVDVVYNHFGEIDNFLPRYAPEWFAPEIETPWGGAVNFREAAVRQFYYENVAMWLDEYDFDGIRFDAVHEIGTEQRDLFLGEVAKTARAIKPDAKLILENVRNNAHWLTRDADNRPVDYSAQWSDDYHHVLNFLITGEPRGGYDDTRKDAVADLEKALADGFVHDGDVDGPSDGRTRHEPASHLPMEAFVSFLQNHDQIGNRPDGSRLVDRIDAGRLDFGRFVTLLNPQVPLFFMGEEASLHCGFFFFFDLPEDAAAAKRADRYRQMSEIFNEAVGDGELPDPNDPETFNRARLDWDSYGQPEHAAALNRFRELAALRRELIWPLTATRCLDAWSARQGDGLIVTWAYEGGTLNMALNPTGEAVEMSFRTADHIVSTGAVERSGEWVRLGPWSALVWRS